MIRDLCYEGDAVIFEEGSIGHEFYIIKSGKVEISHSIGEREKVIAVLQEGDFFGEMALLTDAPRSATAKAAGEVQLMALSMDEIFGHMEVDPQLTVKLLRHILETLATRLRNANAALSSLVAKIHKLGDEAIRSSFAEGPPVKGDIKLTDL